MNKKIITALTLLLIQAAGAFSQHLPVFNVPSPEIAGLGEYGTVPVGQYTGVPDISIPLHKIEAGKESFPITANYHLASIKPQVQGGCLGLGWSLQTGGYISRSVNGICDEKKHYNGYESGYYAHAHRLKGMTNEQFSNATQNIRATTNNGAYYELSADEFSFNFFGYSGTFYYNENSGWTVISDQNIRVEFNPKDGEGFVALKDLRPEIERRSSDSSYSNNRFFNKFTLITPDGCRYEFGGINATEYSIPYYNRNNSDLIATTWQLSKITTPNNRIITYHYEATDQICDLKYIPQSKKVYNLLCSTSNPSRGRDAMTGFLIMPVRLEKIETPNEIISFNYFYDLTYGNHFWEGALGWKENIYQTQSIYLPLETFNYAQFALFMKGSIDFNTSTALQNSIKQNLKHSILHRISIQSKYNAAYARSIYFSYTFNERRKLSSVVSRDGIPELIPDYAYASGIQYLRGYEIPLSRTPEKNPEYRFTYNTENPMPTHYVNPETDYWGYYVGSNISFAAIPQFRKPVPSLIYSQSDILTEITYPTGGKNRFEYDLNSYSKIVRETHTELESSLGNAGGLRIKAVSQHDRNGLLLGKKRYYYTENKNAGSPSSGILREMPLYEINYTASNGAILEQKSQGGYFASVNNLNSPIVGYSCVIEEILDATGHSQGYIRRRYSNYGTDIHGDTHFDEPAIYCNAAGNSPVKPFTSRSIERGKLLCEEYYSSMDQLLKKKIYHYKVVNPGSFKSAHQTVIFFCADSDSYSYACVGTLTRVYTHSYLPDSITEIQYPSEGMAPAFIKKQLLSYNNHKLLKEEKNLTSKGTNHIVSYTYPTDHKEYQWMVQENILSPIVEKTILQDGKSLKEINSYNHSYTTSKMLPYISRIDRIFDDWSRCTDYQVETTDIYANPVVVITRGVSNIYIWSYEGKQLIARIENASYEKVKNLLGCSPESFSTANKPDDATYLFIEGIRHKLPKAHIFIYKYTPSMQVESVTSPNGQTLFYKYDYLGKLREKYFYERDYSGKDAGVLKKKILNISDYHYQH